MKYTSIAILFSLILLVGFDTAAQEVKIDSLVLRHKSNGTIEIIKKYGHKIYVKTNDKKQHFGRFIYHTGDHLVLTQDDQITKISFAEISSIKRRHNVVSGVTSMMTNGSGYIAMALATGSAVGGIATVENSPAVGYGLMAVSIPLFYYGFKWIIAGRGTTKTFKLKKWEVVRTN